MARLDHNAMQRRVRIAEILLAVILVGGALVVGRIIVAGPLFADTITVTVDVPDAAGLHPRADVSYRGQHIGVVKDVELSETGIRATLELDGEVEIPRDSEVVIANLSAVGEQYVDIRPRTASGPYLRDGSTITLDTSALPVPTWQVLTHSEHLLRRIDTRDLEVIAREIQALFGGGDLDLRGLVGELQRSLGMAERLTPTLIRLLDDAETPLRTMRDLAPELRSLVADARSITRQLARSNETIAHLIDTGATLLPVILEDFEATAPILVRMLEDGTPVAAMARDHLPGLLHWYRWGPEQLVAMAESTRDQTGHVILVITPADNCRYGPEVSPYERDVRLPAGARCTTTDPHIQQRGSQNVPRP